MIGPTPLYRRTFLLLKQILTPGTRPLIHAYSLWTLSARVTLYPLARYPLSSTSLITLLTVAGLLLSNPFTINYRRPLALFLRWAIALFDPRSIVFKSTVHPGPSWSTLHQGCLYLFNLHCEPTRVCIGVLTLSKSTLYQVLYTSSSSSIATSPTYCVSSQTPLSTDYGRKERNNHLIQRPFG